MKTLVVCKNKLGSEEGKACDLISEMGFDVKMVWNRDLKKEDLEGIDFVISIGGDGTALSAANYLVGKPLLAVNSSPRTSEGALTTINLDGLENKLDEIKRGKHKIEKLERIEVSINGNVQGLLALNEVFVANDKAYLISRYKIKFEGGGSKVEENQISSGVIFSTGTGSTGWFKSAGGEPFSPHAKFIKMVVREPYIRRLHRFSLIEKTIEEGDLIEISTETKSILVIDSIREFGLDKDDRVSVRISENPLIRIV